MLDEHGWKVEHLCYPSMSMRETHDTVEYERGRGADRCARSDVALLASPQPGEGPPSFRLGPRRVVYAEDKLLAWVKAQEAAEINRRQGAA